MFALAAQTPAHRKPTKFRSLVVALSSSVLFGSLLVTAAPANAAGAEVSSVAAVRKPVRDRNISDKGVVFVIAFEGLRQDYYNDPAGYCTVGYGHLVDGERACTSSELKQRISRKRARAYLRSDLAKAESILDRMSGSTPVTQAEFDALTDFVYNIGSGNFAGSKVLEDLRARPVRYGSVPTHFKSFTTANRVILPGLVRRRNAEGNLFRRGDYSPYPQAR